DVRPECDGRRRRQSGVRATHDAQRATAVTDGRTGLDIDERVRGIERKPDDVRDLHAILQQRQRCAATDRNLIAIYQREREARRIVDMTGGRRRGGCSHDGRATEVTVDELEAAFRYAQAAHELVTAIAVDGLARLFHASLYDSAP